MTYYRTKADGSRIPLEEGGVLVDPIVVTVAKELTVEESGAIFSLQGATDGAAITLPAVATSAGVEYKFVVGSAFATTDWTVVSATNVIEGNVIVDGASIAASNENTISFVASAESVGDYVSVSCDGTSWLASGSGVAAGSITFTAP